MTKNTHSDWNKRFTWHF